MVYCYLSSKHTDQIIQSSAHIPIHRKTKILRVRSHLARIMIYHYTEITTGRWPQSCSLDYRLMECIYLVQKMRFKDSTPFRCFPFTRFTSVWLPAVSQCSLTLKVPMSGGALIQNLEFSWKLSFDESGIFPRWLYQCIKARIADECIFCSITC